MQLRPTVFAAVPQIYDRFADGIRTVSTPSTPEYPAQCRASLFLCASAPIVPL